MKNNPTRTAQQDRSTRNESAERRGTVPDHHSSASSQTIANGHVATVVLARAESSIQATVIGLAGTPPRRLSARYRLAKRTLDLVIAIPALVFLAPLLALIVALIKLDSPGPAIFRQARVGEGGRIFEMLKFRSMRDGTGLLNGHTHKPEKDKRVTRVGRILRRTSLDELPQLINVVRGEMSLVGPRPEIVEIMLEKYEPWQYQRLSVPQGITGWWQVTGRGAKPLFKHTHDDLYYIENASFLFDLRILLMTARAVVRRDGAF